MNEQLKLILDQKFGFNMSTPLDVKRNTLITKLQEATPYVNQHPQARADAEAYTAYIRAIDLEIAIIRKNQANVAVAGQYSGTNNYYPAVTTTPTNPYAAAGYAPVDNTNPNTVHGSTTDRFNMNGANTHTAPNDSVDRFNAGKEAQVPKKEVVLPIKHIPVNGVYGEFLRTNNMVITKDFINNSQYYKWKVDFTYGPDEGETENTSRIYTYRNMIDPDSTEIKVEDKVIGLGYKYRLSNLYLDLRNETHNSECDILVNMVYIEEVFDTKNEIPRFKNSQHSIQLWDPLYNNMKVWNVIVNNDSFVKTFIDRKFADVISLCFNAIIPEEPVIIDSFFTECEELYNLFLGKTNRSDYIELMRRVDEAFQMAGDILEQDFTNEDTRIQWGKSGLPEGNGPAQSEFKFKNKESFVAMYTEHKDFINLDQINNMYSDFHGRKLRLPLKLDNTYHKGLISIMEKFKKHVKFELITPYKSYLIYRSNKSNTYFLVDK